ncbi:hypothetical protein [Endozoicomonas sp. Mp262]|uniref:hypothetical protein n=1 Tax=Endozoicomonas sp. Mp262 TaxID=2919499 RepID=UPI0021DAE568
MWWPLKKISSCVYKSIHCLTRCIPESIRPYVRPILIGASACGTAATIIADFIVHLFNAGVFTNPSVTGVACPTIIIAGVISGAVLSVIIVYRSRISESDNTLSLNNIQVE